jgi:DNA topoisomerase IB
MYAFFVCPMQTQTTELAKSLLLNGVRLVEFKAAPASKGSTAKGAQQFITVHGRVIPIGPKQEGAKPATRTKETPEQAKARTERVMGKLPAIDAAIPKLRATVATDIKKSDAQKERVAAAVARIMDATTMRVGSEKFATKTASGKAEPYTTPSGKVMTPQDSFGASSLRKSHVSVEGDTVRFSFPGKSRKNWQREVNDPELAAVVRHLQSLPGDRLMQFHAGDSVKPFTEVHAREYLAQHGITPKNIRTHHATKLAAELLAQKGTPRDAKEAQRHITEVVQKVSEHLGNTPAMARGSYIHPVVLAHHAAKAGTSATMSALLLAMMAGEKKDRHKDASDERFTRLLEHLRGRVYGGFLYGPGEREPDWDEDDEGDEDGYSDDGDSAGMSGAEVARRLLATFSSTVTIQGGQLL